MRASLERKLIRWLHIVISVPIVGYIYGPVASIPRAALAVKLLFFPLLVLSGLWLWKGHLVRALFRKKGNRGQGFSLAKGPGDRSRSPL